MRDMQFGQHLGVVDQEVRVLQQIAGDGVFVVSCSLLVFG
jgi:hypothetical protein